MEWRSAAAPEPKAVRTAGDEPVAKCPACMNSVSRLDLIRTNGSGLQKCKSCGEVLQPNHWMFALHFFLSAAVAFVVRHNLEPHFGRIWSYLVYVLVLLVVLYVIAPLQKLKRSDAAV
jgi:hypothetical protein